MHPIWYVVCLAHRSVSTKRISIGSAIFVQLTTKSLYNGPSPLKLPLCMGIWTPSNVRFLAPTQVYIPNGIWIGPAIFAGLTIVTDRPTDRYCYSACNNRPYLHNTMMRPKKSSSNLCTQVPTAQALQNAHLQSGTFLK